MVLCVASFLVENGFYDSGLDPLPPFYGLSNLNNSDGFKNIAAEKSEFLYQTEPIASGPPKETTA